MDTYSITLTILFASSPVEPVVVNLVVDVVGVDVGSAVAIGAVGAKDDANVEGTIVLTVGMTVAGELSILAFFVLHQAIQFFLHLLQLIIQL